MARRRNVKRQLRFRRAGLRLRLGRGVSPQAPERNLSHASAEHALYLCSIAGLALPVIPPQAITL